MPNIMKSLNISTNFKTKRQPRTIEFELIDFKKNYSPNNKDLQVTWSQSYTFDQVSWSVKTRTRKNSQNEFALAIELWCEAEKQLYPIATNATFSLLHGSDQRKDFSQSILYL